MTTPFGKAVRHLRDRKGVSQKEMAAALGVSPAYLSALEHGKRGTPSFDFLQRVAGYFNVIWDEAVPHCADFRPPCGGGYIGSSARIHRLCQPAFCRDPRSAARDCPPSGGYSRKSVQFPGKTLKIP
jgi:transcriptional regulator with XRE-family HTH domain